MVLRQRVAMTSASACADALPPNSASIGIASGLFRRHQLADMSLTMPPAALTS